MAFILEIKQELSKGWMGLLLVLAVALLSRFLHGTLIYPYLREFISEILVAVLTGLFIGNTFPLSKEIQAGANFALQRLLRMGIILLGLRMSLQDVAATGLTALVLVCICISFALVLSYLAGRIFRVPSRLSALIGIGTAVCGNTAIIAAAPVLEADEEQMGFAVATITLFGLLAVLFYPLIGNWIGLSNQAFGLWAGTAVNDTSQVVAVGAIYSETSLDVATIVKLTRNSLLAPVLVLIGLVYTRSMNNKSSASGRPATRLNWNKLIPGFVVGFLFMASIRTMGVATGFLPISVTEPGDHQGAAMILGSADDLSKFLILMALAGVGLNTDLGSLRRIGIKPLLVGTCVAVLLAAFSLGLVLYSPLGG